jgi:hypothetical protein
MDYETLKQANEYAKIIEDCKFRVDKLVEMRTTIEEKYSQKEGPFIQVPYYCNQLPTAIEFISKFISKEEYLKAINSLIDLLDDIIVKTETELSKL